MSRAKNICTKKRVHVSCLVLKISRSKRMKLYRVLSKYNKIIDYRPNNYQCLITFVKSKIPSSSVKEESLGEVTLVEVRKHIVFVHEKPTTRTSACVTARTFGISNAVDSAIVRKEESPSEGWSDHGRLSNLEYRQAEGAATALTHCWSSRVP